MKKELSIAYFVDEVTQMGVHEGERATQLGAVQPRVSIVIPTMNVCDELSATLDSIAQQSLAQAWIEVVVADAGSSDATPALLKTRSGEISRYVVGRDSGIAHGIDRGIALCTSPAIIVVCAGDLFSEGQLARSLELLDAHPDAGYAYGDVEMFDNQTGQVTRRARGLDNFAQKTFDAMAVAPHPSVCARRAVFEQIGVLDMAHPYCADFDWIARMWRAGIFGVYASELCPRSPEGGTTNQHANRRDKENLAITRKYQTMPLVPAYSRFVLRLLMNSVRNRLESMGAQQGAYRFRRLVDKAIGK